MMLPSTPHSASMFCGRSFSTLSPASLKNRNYLASLLTCRVFLVSLYSPHRHRLQPCRSDEYQGCSLRPIIAHKFDRSQGNCEARSGNLNLLSLKGASLV